MTRHQHCEQENLPKRFSYTAIQKLTEKHLRRITKIALYLFNHVSQEQTSWTVFLKIRTHNIFWPKYRTVGKYGRRYARACLAFPGAWWDLFLFLLPHRDASQSTFFSVLYRKFVRVLWGSASLVPWCSLPIPYCISHTWTSLLAIALVEMRTSIRNSIKFTKMPELTMFITAVCVLFKN